MPDPSDKRKRLPGGQQSPSAVPDGKRRRVDPPADQASFWDDVANAGDASLQSESLLMDVLTQTSRGDLLLKDASVSELLSRKTGPIMKITGASQLALKENRLYIGGGPEVKEAVKMYADIVIRAAVPSQYESCDMVRLHVSEEFAAAFVSRKKGDGDVSEEEEMERSEGVLIVTERRSGEGGGKLQVGDSIEAYGQHGHWRMATVTEVPASQCVRARDNSDLHEELVPLRRTRLARSIAIFGKAENRLAAAIRVASLFEDVSAGSLLCLQNNPSLQGKLVGVMSEKLSVRPDVMWRLDKSPYLTSIRAATRCSIMFFSGPAADSATPASKSKIKSVPHVLVAGSLEERWKGLQMVKTIAAGMHERRHPALPRSLVGDARKVRIPKDMLSVVVGKNMSAMMEMMRSTVTVILPLKENNDKEMELLDNLVLEGAETKSCDIAILGEPLARAIAELKIRALVEKHIPGYAEQDYAAQTASVHQSSSKLLGAFISV